MSDNPSIQPPNGTPSGPNLGFHRSALFRFLLPIATGFVAGLGFIFWYWDLWRSSRYEPGVLTNIILALHAPARLFHQTWIAWIDAPYAEYKIYYCMVLIQWLLAGVLAGAGWYYLGRIRASSNTQQVPGLVRVYGLIIMIFNAIGMGFSALQTLLWMLNSGSEYMFAYVIGALLIAINFGFYRLGKGLRAGERQAVYGLCALCGLTLLVGIGFLVAGQSGVGLAMLAAVAIIYAPPVVTAFACWTTFK